jgi:hypothetical protein
LQLGTHDPTFGHPQDAYHQVRDGGPLAIDRRLR